MAGQTGRLRALPAEIILSIMTQMRVSDLTAFALTNRRHLQLFNDYQPRVMATVLMQQPEFEFILYVYTTNRVDFCRDAMLYPRIISFDLGRDDGTVVHFTHFPVSFQGGKLICPRKIKFGLQEVAQVWNMTRVIDWWVEEYPRLRWHQNPEDRRCLKPSEEMRLRKAVARWWLFAECFHNDWVRYAAQPRKWQTDDSRLHHIRLASTVEIRELDSLWAIVESTVSRDVCADVEVDEHHVVESVPWGHYDYRSKAIVHTYMKLDPEQLKELIEKRPKLNKASTIQAAQQTQIFFASDQEMLSSSIDTVLQERLMLKPNNISVIPFSGILDEESFADADGLFTNDSWPSGKPPLTKHEISSYPVELQRSVPNGDDGLDFF